MSFNNILIVEDDRDISEMIRYNLTKEGFQVSAVFDGLDVFSSIKEIIPDLIILDIMLPRMNGLDICKKLKREDETEDILIIMLTAKSQEFDKVLGLELGADDYVTKPFSPKELVARVRAVLRRKKTLPNNKMMMFGNLVIYPEKFKVTVKSEPVSLTITEFKLLSLLVSRPGMVISREEILDHVFGYNSSSYDRTVDAHIKSLRKKIGPARDYIETVRSVGYRFKESFDEE